MSVEAPERTVPPSLAVVEAVAARQGVDPMALERTLFEAIDPDALDRLVRSAAEEPSYSPFSVSFRYYGYGVVVSSDSAVDLRRRADARSW